MSELTEARDMINKHGCTVKDIVRETGFSKVYVLKLYRDNDPRIKAITVGSGQEIIFDKECFKTLIKKPKGRPAGAKNKKKKQ